MVAQSQPSRVDPLVSRLSEVVGGPAGRRVGRHPWWTPLRVVLALTGATLAGGMLSKGACVAARWTDGDQPYAELCWTELAGVAATSRATPGWTSYVDTGPTVLALLLAVVALGGAWLVTTTAPGRHSWAGAGWAVSPVLLTQWLSWEVAAAVALAALLWALPRRRWLVAGVAAVVAAACSPWATSRPFAIDVGSWWLVAQQRLDSEAATTVVAVVVLGCVALVVAALVLLARTRRLGAPAALTLVLVALLLVAPSAPPEAALLLLPGAALAVGRWRDLLGWQACEVVSWALTGWYLGGVLAPSGGGDATTYWAAVAIRSAGLLWLAAAVLRPVPGPDTESGQAMTTRSNAVAV